VTDAEAPHGTADDVPGLVRDGQAKFASGEVEEARTAFSKALKLKPDDAGAKAGLERCDRLLAERGNPPPELALTPPWPSDGPRSEDFPDSGDNPEATIVDPNYLMDIGVVRGPDAGASGEFPEPLTVPLAPAIERAGEVPKPASPPKPGGEPASPPAAGGEPSYPRYVASMPGNYPEVRPGGRPAVASPPPIAPGTPLPAPAPMLAIAYPQMPPGGPSAYPHYATPVGGGYAPGPSPGLAAFALPERRRFLIIVGSVGGGCLLLGLLLGWAIFGSSDDDEPAAGTVAPLVAHDAGAQPKSVDAPATPPGDKAKAPVAAASAAAARVYAVERPVLAAVTAPTAGRVLKLHVQAAAHVKAGAKLYTIKGDKKARLPEAIVQAPRAGRFEVRAAQGDDVAEGGLLGLVVDPDAWLLIADLTGDALAPGWGCEVASGDGISRSPCRIDSVEHLGGGRIRATARVAARDAGWLKGDEKDLMLNASPP